VTLFLYFRKPNNTHWSIEFIFQSVRKIFDNHITTAEKVCPYFSTGFLNRIRAIRWARQQRPNAEIHHVTGDVHFLVLGLPRSTTILTIHDLSFLKKGTIFSKAILWFFWVYLPVWRVRFVTCVSEESKKDIVKFSRCDPGKVVVIYNFLRPQFSFTPKVFDKRSPVLLQVGTNYNKNLERLASAIIGLHCRLRIIGPLQPDMVTILNRHNIQFSNVSGLTEAELLSEYINADIVTFCSTYEGFGLPIIEGQAVGRIVITSNASSMPEVAGEGACLVNPNDVQSIRSAIIKVINDDDYRENTIQKGLLNVGRFSIEVIAKKYLSLYQRVLKLSMTEK
jgi:glycosyltransferase involved in cell wall biosynthesis